MDYDTFDDQHLVELAQKANKDAVIALLDRHQDYIRRVVDREVAPDVQSDIDVDTVLQDLFLTLLSGLHTYDPSRGMLRNWLGVVTGNLIRAAARIVRRDNRRRSNPQALNEDDDEGDWFAGHFEAPSSERPSREARRNENREIVHRLLARLPEQDRFLLERHDMYGEPLATLAAQLGISKAAVAMRLVRIRCRCSELLGEENKYFTTND